jgi:hypothetical protein
MKTALCITGIYRPWVNPPIPYLIEEMKKILNPTDVYYHTWSEYKDKTPFDVHHCPEPVLNYHPVDDVTVECLHGKFIKYKENKLFRNKTFHRNKQLLGYADLMSKIPDDYDLIIRARWETIVSNKFNYKKYMDIALEKGPVGFMIREKRKQPQTVHDDFKVSKDIYEDWFQFLPDALIFHKKEQYNIDLVKTLHKQKNLLPAEWGWYQILSKPYGTIHTSVHGGAHVAK